MPVFVTVWSVCHSVPFGRLCINITRWTGGEKKKKENSQAQHFPSFNHANLVTRATNPLFSAPSQPHGRFPTAAMQRP